METETRESAARVNREFEIKKIEREEGYFEVRAGYGGTTDLIYHHPAALLHLAGANPVRVPMSFIEGILRVRVGDWLVIYHGPRSWGVRVGATE